MTEISWLAAAAVLTAQTQPQPQPQSPASAPAPQPAAATLGNEPAVLPESTAAAPARIEPVAGPADAMRPAPTFRLEGGRDADAAAPVIAPITTLADAIALAYRTNPRLTAQRASVRSADYRYPAARSAFGPSASLSGAYTFDRARIEIFPGRFVGQQGFTSTASLILNQPVFTFGRSSAAEAGALAEIAYARDSLRLIEADVLLNVVSAYVGVLRDAGAVTIARENLALLERQYRDNTERFRVREITVSDLQQVETRVELGRSQLVAAQGQLGIAQSQFLQFVGAPPGELARPDLLQIPFASIDQAYALADVNSPVIRAAQSREKISRASVEAAKAESRPRVDLRGTGDYGTVSPYTDQLRTTQFTGQVVLTQPLIDSGLRNARRGEAAEANQADWRLIDSAVRDTHQAVGSAWDQLTASRASLDSYRRAVDAAQRAYEGAQLQQKAGDRTTLDVLDLARDLLNLRLSYNAALADEYAARAGLLSAVGQLEAPLVTPGVRAYDPAEHFEQVRHRGDIPLLTPALAALDGAVNRDVTRDRPIRDPGAAEGVAGTVPLQAADPASQPTQTLDRP